MQRAYSVLLSTREKSGQKVYYCHPYSSWERGTNEVTNKMIRRKIPKGTNFDDRTEEEVEYRELDKRIPTQNTWLSFSRGTIRGRGKAACIRTEIGERERLAAVAALLLHCLKSENIQ